MPSKAVFFDRDNTLIEDPGYLRDPDAVRLMPGAADALRGLREAGYQIVVVTNQSGVARGLLDEPALEAVHERIRHLFAEQGATIDAIYYCPYLDGPEAVVEKYRRDSDLRKPRPGMFLLAARERNIDLSASWAIGDSGRDVEAGRAAGCRTIQLVRESAHPGEAAPDFRVKTLTEAVNCIRDHARGKPNPSSTFSVAPSRSERLIEEIAEHVRIWHRRSMMDDFTLAKLAGAVTELVAIGVAFWALMAMIEPSPDTFPAHRWLAAIFLQLLALTFFYIHGRR